MKTVTDKYQKKVDKYFKRKSKPKTNFLFVLRTNQTVSLKLLCSVFRDIPKKEKKASEKENLFLFLDALGYGIVENADESVILYLK